MDITQAKAAWIDNDGGLHWNSERSGGLIPPQHPSRVDALRALDELGILVGDMDPLLTLDAIKAALKTRVDQAAEAERLKYITLGDGQAMTYQQKVAEAQAYKDAADPQSADYPLLMSEVGITASTLGEVADIVLAAFAQWQLIGAAIEGIRLGAKRDIDAAADEAAARAIVDAIEWPQPAL